MSAILVAAALLFAWVVGCLWVAALMPRERRNGDLTVVLGAGYVAGALLAGNLLWIQGNERLGAALLMAGLMLAGAAVPAWMLARDRLMTIQPVPGVARRRPDPVPRWVRLAMISMLLLALCAILAQSWALPILMWDAWNAWLAKSKAWHFSGSFLPAYGVDAWLQQTPGKTLGVVAASYPESLPRWVTALSFLYGSWNDGVAALPWALLWPAGGALLYGALQRRGASSGQALLAAGALLTLPMVLAHSTLAGYMDLWLAFGVLLATLAGESWLRHRSIRSFIAFVLSVLLLPSIKLEGAVYSAILVLTFLFWWLPARVRLVALATCVLVLPAFWWTVGIALPVPGLGSVQFHRELISLPVVGAFVLDWQPVGDVVAKSMLWLPNWSLLWFAAPLLPVFLWWQRPAHRAAATFLLLAAAFHFMLFFFTHASAWAEDLTSLNRLLLHVVPVWVWVGAAVLTRPGAVRGRFS